MVKAVNGVKQLQPAEAHITSLSQMLLADLELLLSVFYQHLCQLYEEHKLDENLLIINIDKVPMVFDMVPGSTIHCKGKKDLEGLNNWWQKEVFYFLSRHECCW